MDTGDKTSVVSRPYRYDRVKQIILEKKMLKEGIIMPIQSPSQIERAEQQVIKTSPLTEGRNLFLEFYLCTQHSGPVSTGETYALKTRGQKREDLRRIASELELCVSDKLTVLDFMDLIKNCDRYKNDPDSVHELARIQSSAMCRGVFQFLVKIKPHCGLIKDNVDLEKTMRRVWEIENVEPETIKIETIIYQRKLQRILWRENMDEPIKTFELSTVTYGTTKCTSFLATQTLLEAKRTENQLINIFAKGDTINREWRQFVESLQVVNDININRCIVVEQPEVIELHGFSDASQSAYGAVVYCKSITSRWKDACASYCQ
ncbi:hypothetical protein TNCV_2817651 [Trichonephila clavipes]|nr:hypothetical protein TNCV_2817651 [Trichonephila clavipes]